MAEVEVIPTRGNQITDKGRRRGQAFDVFEDELTNKWSISAGAIC